MSALVLRAARATVRASSLPGLDLHPMTDPRPLALGALGTSRAQFEAAVRPELPRLYRFCLSLCGNADQADDIFQNAILKAYLNASSFEGRSDLGVWLCGIARNEYLEVRRTEARRRGIFERVVEAAADVLGLSPERAPKTPEAAAILSEDTDLLLACLQEVPEEFRAVVVLCDIEDLGYDKAAEILGIPKGTVKSRHARGRARLREAYERLAARSAAATREEST